MATPGFSKIKLFWKKVYDAIIFVNVTKKNLSSDSNCIVDVVTWPKFGNCNISMRSYHNLKFIGIWLLKPLFLMGGLGSSLTIWDWH